MRITRIEARAVRIPRDASAVLGTAGSPAPLQASVTGARYRRATTYGTVYATDFETTLVRVETDAGLVGWGEAQAPVLPEVPAAIVNLLLGPLLAGEDPREPDRLWDAMYEAMRVRGHHGGFYVDAMAGVDLALWDLSGKAAGRPVAALLTATPRQRVPVYVSGLAGASTAEKVASAVDAAGRGAHAFKIFLDASTDTLLATIDGVRDALGDPVEIFVDALWRLTRDDAVRFADALWSRRVGWLEAPLAPEDLDGHRQLAAVSKVPVAIGESYRTTFEIQPWLDARAVGVLQPDLGRTGLTGAMRIAALARAAGVPLAPHVSIGLGPQIAAAIHFSCACPDVRVLECNPAVYSTANRFLRTPLPVDLAAASQPAGSGLGVDVEPGDPLRHHSPSAEESIT